MAENTKIQWRAEAAIHLDADEDELIKCKSCKKGSVTDGKQYYQCPVCKGYRYVLIEKIN